MDSTRWEKIQALFHSATELPQSERGAFVRASCGDQDLIADVLGMLQEDAQGTSLLDHDLAHVAQHVLDELPTSLPTKEFGPYRIKELLGEGGMGVVYLAERPDLGTLVAIKILRDAWLSPARRERFTSEQRTLAQLNHPSIARLYDADTLADGTPWFVMEYVEGLPITEYCRQHKCTVEELLRMLRLVCEAVQYAHQHAVIHRDLKPSNIFVKADGSVRLLDFGIAKQLETLESGVEQTQTGLRLMTPAYAAPEQVRGDRLGVHTDVYSLGMVLYELLAGRLPFDLSKRTPAEVETMIVEAEPGKPSDVAGGRVAGERFPGISKTSWADLDVLCLTAMHKDPERRYRSVEALIRDIDHYLKREPLEARPDSMRYRVGKFVRRNQRSVAVSALVITVIVGLVIFFTVRLARARNAALAEAARTERVQRFMMNLFQGGDESVGPSGDLRVITMVDRGVREAQALNTEPKVQAELYQTLGSIYNQLGKLDQADQLLSLSLERRKALFGPDAPEVAESMVTLGLLRGDQAQYEDEEKLVRQGLDIDKRRLPPTHPALGKATYALGRALDQRGQYDQAIPVLEEAVRIQSAPGANTADLIVSLGELANSQFYLGHYDTSESLNQRALTMDRQLYGDRHPNVAEDMVNLGAIQYERGNYKEAERYDRQALDIIRSFFGSDHPETASLMTSLGRALVAQDRLGEASDMLQQALGVEERVYGKVHPRVASTLSDLGKIAQRQGRLDEAVQDFSRMTDIYRTVYKGKHYYIGVALSNLAGVYVDEKQYARAEHLFQEALSMYAGTLAADHQLVAIARIRLGRSLLREKRFAEAEAQSRSGYEILVKKSSPQQNWLNYARQDLAEEYDGLKQPENAAKVRAEMVGEGSKGPVLASGK